MHNEAQNQALTWLKRMNRRAPIPIRGIPGRAAVINWQARQATIKSSDISSQKGIAIDSETVSRLNSDIEVLKKKVAFLQKVDLSALSDEIGDSDVTFIVKNGNMLKAHRFILASKSAVFKKMFDTNMTEKNSGKICVEDISAPVLRGLIEYLYRAEIKFTDQATAADLFKAAHKYDIPELQAECEAEIFSTISEDNLSEMLRISHQYGMNRIMAKCVRILKDNFDQVHGKVLNDLLS